MHRRMDNVHITCGRMYVFARCVRACVPHAQVLAVVCMARGPRWCSIACARGRRHACVTQHTVGG